MLEGGDGEGVDFELHCLGESFAEHRRRHNFLGIPGRPSLPMQTDAPLEAGKSRKRARRIPAVSG
jgi:hypothetical protein